MTMDFKLDKGNGYMYCYAPDSEFATKSGKVYEHRYVMQVYLGRQLKEDECVHHIDRNKTNNDISNLQLMTIDEHARLHKLEDGDGQILAVTCAQCGLEFESISSENRKFCSKKCSTDNVRKINIDIDDLRELVWSMPTSKVAKKLGVSDVAIGKLCKKWVSTNPREGTGVRLRLETYRCILFSC